MTNIERVDVNNIACNIVKFETNDFIRIKSFVKEICEYLDEPSFFIIDDIDIVLPTLLNDKNGLVYGIVCKNEIIAVQAVDYDINNILGFNKELGLPKDIVFMELGWAMVNTKFRKKNLSTKLANLIEFEACKEIRSNYFAVTVHPINTSSLFLFFRLGYIGVKLIQYFDVIRLVMIKKINFTPVASKEKLSMVSTSDYEKQNLLFKNGYVCNNVLMHQENVSIAFYKYDFKKMTEKPAGNTLYK
jgi:hypothetical protein